MKHLIIKIIMIAFLISSISACGNKESTKTSKTKANTAVVTIDKTIYQIPVQICNKPRTDTFKGQSMTHYSIVAQKNNNGKSLLLINAVKGTTENVANYKLELSSKGAKRTFLGKTPYNIFDGKNFHYKGMTNLGSKTFPIEIKINCKS